jgi:hypothetical protein
MAINSKKTVFYWNLVLKSIFGLILIYFLYRQLILNNDLSLSWKHFVDHLEDRMTIFILACLALMPLNWSLESKKWQLLVLPFEKISFYRSFKAILSGISIALLTPNRIGEYGGRMVMVEAKNNWKAVISTLISSYAQNIWNIGLGLLSAMILLHQRGELNSYLYSSGIIVSTLFLALLIIIYFNIDLTSSILRRFKRYKLVEKSLFHLKLLKQYSFKILFNVLLLALVRYLVYFLQYYLILHFFGLEISITNAFIGIATIFLVQTSLPLPPVLGFLARGEIALLVWQGFEFNELSILASSYILWFLNLIIPSILGAAIIFTSNLSRTLGLSRNYLK